MKQFLLSRFPTLLATFLLLASMAGSALAAENKESPAGEIEIFEMPALEISAEDTSLFTLDSNGTVALKSGSYVNWIDRLDLSDASYARDFYDWLVENSDNDGTNDALIDVTTADGNGSSYWHTVEVDYSVEYVYSDPPGADYAGKMAVADVASEKMDAVMAHLQAAYLAFDRDHPEVFWLSGGVMWGYGPIDYGENRYSNGTGEMDYTVIIYFYLQDPSEDFDVRSQAYQTPAAIRSDIAVRNSTVNTVIAAATGAAEAKVAYFNEWLTNANGYNSSADLNTIDTVCHRSISALKGSYGTVGPVCDGYARAFKVLCDAASIPCVLVDGIAGFASHMWNYVQMDDGKWYAVDVTWNDPRDYDATGAVSGYENEDYLLVGANTEINYDTFSESHFIQNSPATNGPKFTNGPKLADTRFISTTLGGTSNTGASWALSRSGVLTISGSGAMPEYPDYDENRPWSGYNDLITQVVIGRNVTQVSDTTFQNCPNLTSITVEAGNAYYSSEDGVLFTRDKTRLIQYPVAKTDALYTVPATVTTIGTYAFAECTTLINVTLPAALTRMENYAFASCTGLDSVTIPAGLTEIPGGAFMGCTALKSVSILGDVTQIGQYAFYPCAELKKIALPASLTYLLDSAFRDSGLTDIYFAGNAQLWADILATSSDQIPGGVTMHYNCSNPVKITAQPADASASNGSSVRFTVAATGSGLTYQWQWRATGGWNNTTLPGYNTQTVTVPVSNSTDGRQYRCVVTDANGLQVVSTPAVLTKTIKLLDTPVLTEAFNSSTGVRVSWKAVDGAEKYRLLRKNLTKGETEWSSMGETADCTLIDKTAKSASRYTYTVECIDADGTVVSAHDETGRTCTYIAMAKITGVTSVDEGLKIEWEKPGGAKNFRVMRKLDGGAWKVLTDVLGNSYVDTTVEDGVKYWYTVRAITLAGDMYINSYNSFGWSGTWTAPLDTPVLTEAFNSSTGVRVSWKAVDGAEEYRLLRKNVTKGEEEWVSVGETTDCTMIDKTVASASRYTFTVECIDADGNAISKRNETGRTCTYIALAKVTSVTSTEDGLEIEWQKPAGAKNFRVMRKVDGGSWKILDDVLGNSYVDTNVEPGVKYWYTVRAVTLAGDMYINSYNATGWSGRWIQIVTQPTDQTASGGYVYFTVEAEGEGLTYQWQWKSAAVNGTWANTTLTGCNTDTLRVTANAINNGRQYRCIVTDKYNNEVISDAATLIKK